MLQLICTITAIVGSGILLIKSVITIFQYWKEKDEKSTTIKVLSVICMILATAIIIVSIINYHPGEVYTPTLIIEQPVEYEI